MPYEDPDIENKPHDLALIVCKLQEQVYFTGVEMRSIAATTNWGENQWEEEERSWECELSFCLAAVWATRGFMSG